MIGRDRRLVWAFVIAWALLWAVILATYPKPATGSAADPSPTREPTALFSDWPGPTERIDPVPVTPAPSSQPTRSTSGLASWYAGSRNFESLPSVALPDGRWTGAVNGYVTVCVENRCARLAVVDWCQCYRGTARERIVDLSLAAVRALELDPARGLYRATVTR